MITRLREDRSAFSLIEVVIATAIFATAIVAVIGLLSPMTKRVDDVIDSEIAARLSASIQSELERVGFATAVTLITPITLYANPNGTVVRLGSGPAPYPVDRDPEDTELPGIPLRERYFRITLHQLTGDLAYDPDTSGALSLRADVEWPFWIPDGPASAGGNSYTEVPALQRQRLSYFFAIRP